MMPVYQFVCEKHGVFEKITIRAEWDDIRCPKCGVKSEVDKKMQFREKNSLPIYKH
jgi:putative FmdB family regulatory protein